MVSAVPSRSNHTIHPPRSNRITVLLLVWAGFTGIFSPWERVRSLRSTRFEWEISNDHIPGGCWKEWSTESVTTEIVWGCQPWAGKFISMTPISKHTGQCHVRGHRKKRRNDLRHRGRTGK